MKKISKRMLDGIEYIPTYDGHRPEEVLNVLRSSGRSRMINDFPILETYLSEAGTHPYMRNYGDIYLNHEEFMKDFEKLVNNIYYQREGIDDESLEIKLEYGIYNLGKGYIGEVNIGYSSVDNFSTGVQDLLRRISGRNNTATTSSLTLYLPPLDSPFKNEELENEIKELINKHKLEKNTSTPSVGMICYDDGDFYMKDFYIKKDYSIKDGDLHYGEGFMNFHTSLIERFKTDPKGLVLLHGLPGTGKTYYIRSLIKDLLSIGKYVIYLPPNMIETMVDPSMLNFLSTVVMEKAEENKSCVLLLEDAEPLLVSRKTENRSGGITNLLNVTDGLLNDMLTIQVIATFNTELSNIDEALLRPERLIARKEFKALKKADAQILSDSLNSETVLSGKVIEKDSTLAEIYSQSKHSETLIHEYNNESRKIGFGK
jgi:hypothetical protein